MRIDYVANILLVEIFDWRAVGRENWTPKIT